MISQDYHERIIALKRLGRIFSFCCFFISLLGCKTAHNNSAQIPTQNSADILSKINSEKKISFLSLTSTSSNKGQLVFASNNLQLVKMQIGMTSTDSKPFGAQSPAMANLISQSPFNDQIFIAQITNTGQLKADSAVLSPGCHSFAIESESQSLLVGVRGVSLQAFFSTLPKNYWLSTTGDLCLNAQQEISAVSFLSQNSTPDWAFTNFVNFLHSSGVSLKGVNYPGGLGLIDGDNVPVKISQTHIEIPETVPVPVRAEGEVLAASKLPVTPAASAEANANLAQALNVPPARAKLLDLIQTTYFGAQKPDRLLYFGAGADVDSPYLATHVQKMVFVDVQEPYSSIATKMQTINGSSVTTNTSGKETIFSSSESNAPLNEIDYYQTGHVAYMSTKGEDTNFDVIFDKDSWIEKGDAEAVIKAGTSLKTGGYWISNHFSSLGPYADLFQAAGMERVTNRISSNDAYIFPFGNLGNVEVLQKTANYNAAAFTNVYQVYKKTLPINVIFSESVDLKNLDDELLTDMVDDAFSSASVGVTDAAIIAKINTLHTTFLAEVLALKRLQTTQS